MRVWNRLARSRTRARKSTRCSAVKYTLSFFRSHCHSASETFMGRAWLLTRSITRRRTSSSSRCSCSATAASSGVARRRTRWVGSGGGAAAASARLQPLQLPAHFFAATGPTADTRPRSCPRSTSTITESCRASGSADGQEKNSFRFPLNRTSMTSVNSLLAQRTHRKVLLLPAFEELLDPHLAQLPHVASQRVAQHRGGGLRIGVRSARRLGDDLVDDPELQQVFGRDLERLGGPLPLARVLPEDGGATFGGDDRV